MFHLLFSDVTTYRLVSFPTHTILKYDNIYTIAKSFEKICRPKRDERDEENWLLCVLHISGVYLRDLGE